LLKFAVGCSLQKIEFYVGSGLICHFLSRENVANMPNASYRGNIEAKLFVTVLHLMPIITSIPAEE